LRGSNQIWHWILSDNVERHKAKSSPNLPPDFPEQKIGNSIARRVFELP
jgi:hypothetical protein